MAELGSTERYASAALFTLALHSTQVDNWVPSFIDVNMAKVKSGSSEAVMAAWGCPKKDDFPFDEFSEERESETFWGWDSVRTRGLCQRVYRHLDIPERSWPALLNLPEVAGYPSQDVKEFVNLVRTYVALLDKTVAKTGAVESSQQAPMGEEGHDTQEEVSATGDNDGQPTEADEHRTTAAFSHQEGHSVSQAAKVLSGCFVLDSPGGSGCFSPPLSEQRPVPRSAVPDSNARALTELQESERDLAASGGEVAPAHGGSSAQPAQQGPEEDVWAQEAARQQGLQAGRSCEQPLHPSAGVQGPTPVPLPAREQAWEAWGRDWEATFASSQQQQPGSSTQQPAPLPHSSHDNNQRPQLSPTLLVEQQSNRGEAGGGRNQGETSADSAQAPREVEPPVSPGQKATIMAETPLTAHVIEGHMAQVCDDEADTNSLRDGAAGPASNNLKRRGMAAVTSLFRRYSPLDDTRDFDDLNYEIEKDILDAQLNRTSADGPREEEELGSAQLGADERPGVSSSMHDSEPANLGYFEKHVGAARTDTQTVLAEVSHRRKGGLEITPEALGVLWELLTATLDVNCDEEYSAVAEDILGDALDEAEAAVRGGNLPGVRWYDARSRIAIRMVAEWLRVPWKRVLNLEALLATTYMFPQPGEERKTRHWTSSRALKVGAAAIAGGGLLALTGGLAAPAIAVGLGAAVSVLGGTAAQAGIVSGLASTAAVAGTFGTYGSTVFGRSMINRTALVTEFGFCSLEDRNEEALEQALSDVIPEMSTVSTSEREHYLQQSGNTSGMGNRPRSAASLADAKGEEAGTSQAAHLDHNSSVPKSSQQTGRWTWSSMTSSRRRSASTDDLPRAGNALSIHQAQSNQKAVVNGEEASQWKLWWQSRKCHLPTLPAPVNLKPDRCRLAVTIAVNGWVQCEDDYVDPWKILDGSDCERYAIVWESNRLTKLGGALTSFVGTKVADQTAKWFIQHFWFTALLSSVAIPSLIITSSAVIDNAWSVALYRAESAGRVLANVLMARAHGDRPVKMYGFSMGARLIFHCLMELYKNNCLGIVEEVVLLGTPVSISENRWAMARSVVSGRFVNGYSNRDWVLGVVYRTANGFTKRCGGLQAVPVRGIENANLSSLITGHTEYMAKLPDIMDALNLSM